MAWAKNGTTTLTSSGDTVTVSSLTDNSNLMVLGHIESTGGDTVSHIRANADTAGNYALRNSLNGAADATSTSTNRFITTHNSKTNDSRFIVGYFFNIATEEKLAIVFVCENPATGAGTAPSRIEAVGKHAQTSNPIDEFLLFNDEAGSFNTDSNLTVLGSDGTEVMTVQDGAIYYDTTLNKEYVLYNNTWTEV